MQVRLSEAKTQVGETRTSPAGVTRGLDAAHREPEVRAAARRVPRNDTTAALR